MKVKSKKKMELPMYQISNPSNLNQIIYFVQIIARTAIGGKHYDFRLHRLDS